MKEKKSTTNANKKSSKINMREIVEKRFSKKKENFRYMMFENVVVKNSNARILIKHFIENTTLFSNVIKSFSFKFKNFSEKESEKKTK